MGMVTTDNLKEKVYKTTKDHPTLLANINISQTYDKRFYMVGEGVKIVTYKEVKYWLDNKFIVPNKDLKSILYTMVDKSINSGHIGGDRVVLRILKEYLDNFDKFVNEM